MKKKIGIIISSVIVLTMLNNSCITNKYIQDRESHRLQTQIHQHRIGNFAGDAFLTLGSAILAAFTGIYLEYIPVSSLKKIAIDNTSQDTLQINMLTDQFWKDSVYCDFRDIRIPPGKTCRLLVPAGSVYNLYFSNTPDTEGDDELIQFDAEAERKVRLYPGLTSDKDSLSTHKIINP